MDFIRSSSKVALTVLLSFGLLGTAGAQVFYFDSFGGFVTGTDFPAATGTFANDSEPQPAAAPTTSAPTRTRVRRPTCSST